MTADPYLLNIINKYKPRSLALYTNEINNLHSILKSWANGCYYNLVTSGSIAKGTATSISSDIDYLISLTSTCNSTLEQIFNSLHTHLKQYYRVRKQNVSFGLNLNGLNVDVTAAKKRPGNTNYHSLYVSKISDWKQTNIQQHINDISSSGRINEIKLLKIWRELNNLDFPSIYMEYLLISVILRSKSKNNLEGNFYYILSELAKDQNNPLSVRLTDPSNSNNILSELLTANEKNNIIRAAKHSISQTNWRHIVY